MREKAEFDHIFRLYYSQLYYFALQYIADEEEAHDMVSAAYEDVWRKFASIKEETVKQFLYANVRNKCIDLLRRRKCRDRYIEFTSVMASEYMGEQNDAEQEDNERIINNVLNSMGSPTREILLACYVEEKKYKDVAAEMDISISTVKKHIVKALKIIREKKKNSNQP